MALANSVTPKLKSCQHKSLDASYSYLWGRNSHIVHPLQTQPLRLRNQEPHIEEHTKAEAPKDEVRSIPMCPNILHHMRHRLSNHKIEQPLRGSRKCNIHSSQSCGRYLRHDNPAARSPSELEEGCKEEDAGQCEVADAGDGLACDRGLEANIEADHEHGAALGDGGPEERAATTERVGGEQ